MHVLFRASLKTAPFLLSTAARAEAVPELGRHHSMHGAARGSEARRRRKALGARLERDAEHRGGAREDAAWRQADCAAVMMNVSSYVTPSAKVHSVEVANLSAESAGSGREMFCVISALRTHAEFSNAFAIVRDLEWTCKRPRVCSTVWHCYTQYACALWPLHDWQLDMLHIHTALPSLLHRVYLIPSSWPHCWSGHQVPALRSLESVDPFDCCGLPRFQHSFATRCAGHLRVRQRSAGQLSSTEAAGGFGLSEGFGYATAAVGGCNDRRMHGTAKTQNSGCPPYQYLELLCSKLAS